MFPKLELRIKPTGVSIFCLCSQNFSLPTSNNSASAFKGLGLRQTFLFSFLYCTMFSTSSTYTSVCGGPQASPALPVTAPEVQLAAAAATAGSLSELGLAGGRCYWILARASAARAGCLLGECGCGIRHQCWPSTDCREGRGGSIHCRREEERTAPARPKLWLAMEFSTFSFRFCRWKASTPTFHWP